MKTLKKIFALVFVLALMLTLCANAFAEPAESTMYKVRLYAGNIGTVKGGTVFETEVADGDWFTIDREWINVTDNRFYAKGARLSGLDNSYYTAFNPDSGLVSFQVTKDTDFVIAYGMKSTAVQYVVSYLHVTTRINLLPPQIFYGNVGDKPVVAFQYVENYRPQALAITKTLTADPTQNVFEFLYTPLNIGGGGGVVPPGGGGAAGGGGAGGNANQNANAGQNANENAGQNANENAGQNAGGEAAGTPGTETTVPGGETTAPVEVTPSEPVEILDLDVPQAEGPGAVEDGSTDNTVLGGIPRWVAAVGGVIVGGLIVVPIVFLLTTKKKKDEKKKDEKN